MLTPRTALQARRWHAGLSLVESLVAMVILALGVAGLAWTQARLLVDGRQANARATAIMLIADLSNRMLFNQTTAAAGGYALAWGETPGTHDCSAPCTGPELARSDLGAWRLELTRALPRGNASVFRPSDDSAQIGIAVSWPALGSPVAAGDAPSFGAPFAVTPSAHGVQCPALQQCQVAYVQP
jgi:type IV pilus assembly protein PilV